jgi:hypothetical protein
MDGFVPKITEGEDDGSQRSSLTLAMRMWPLLSHAGMERVNVSTGLNLLNEMALKMMAKRDICGITEEHTKLKIGTSFYPVLPKDRDSQVAEAISRMGSNLGSPEHLLDMLGDIDDIEDEMEKILSWMKEKAKIEAEAQPKPFGGQSGGTSSNPPTKSGTSPAK